MAKAETAKEKTRLIFRPSTTDPTTLDDLMLCMAGTIEDSLQVNGAIPGKDYTILDLYKLAQPFAHTIFNAKENDITFTGSW